MFMHCISRNYQWMTDWLQQPIGKCYLASEKEKIGEFLPKLFGYHFLIFGDNQFVSCTADSPINHKILIHPHIEQEDKEKGVSTLTTRWDKLPIGSESVDVIYLAHCLELSNNPHEILRETYRILRPEGYLLVSGFNPWSMWGFLHFFSRFLGVSILPSGFKSPLKLKNWLCLLGFEFLDIRSFCYYPPINNEYILDKMYTIEEVSGKFRLPFAAGYVMVACKRVVTLTPLRPNWRKKKKIIINELIEPITRN